jgi:hypothetical protein
MGHQAQQVVLVFQDWLGQVFSYVTRDQAHTIHPLQHQCFNEVCVPLVMPIGERLCIIIFLDCQLGDRTRVIPVVDTVVVGHRGKLFQPVHFYKSGSECGRMDYVDSFYCTHGELCFQVNVVEPLWEGLTLDEFIVVLSNRTPC